MKPRDTKINAAKILQYKISNNVKFWTGDEVKHCNKWRIILTHLWLPQLQAKNLHTSAAYFDTIIVT